MMKEIQEVYERINNELLSMSPMGPMNTKEYRKQFKERLENEIPHSIIKCDEENNSPNVIYFCCLMVKVSWTENHQQKYCDLIFGHPEQVIKVQRI